MVEKRKIRKYASKELVSAPIFIIGLPRSGSTILFQLVTDILDVTYFNNLSNLGRENIYTALCLGERLFGNKGHKSFSSKYGNTSEDGLNAPAEAGQYWYKYFNVYSDETGTESLSENSTMNLQDEISAIINRFNRPLVIKNLYTVLRIKEMLRIFPNAKFIYLRREPAFVGQSIYEARIRNTDNPEWEWWSVPFPGYSKILGKDLLYQIAKQVVELEHLVSEELELIPENQKLVLDYEKLDIHAITDTIKVFIDAGLRNPDQDNYQRFSAKNKIKVDPEIFEKLEKEIINLNENNV